MIDPSLAVHDLAGCGFELLNDFLARRQALGAHQVQVLHEGGLVVSVVDTRHGVLPGPYPPVTSRAAAVAYWRGRTGSEQVVLVDADRLDHLARLEADLAQPDHSQPELLSGLTAAFWASEAVFADPPVSGSDWSALERRLVWLADATLRLTVVRDGVAQIELSGVFRAGRLVELCGPNSAQLATVGPTIDLRLDWGDFEGLILAPDFPDRVESLLAEASAQ